MAVLVFVLIWVGLAIGLTFIALSGGARGARERLHSQSRGSRRFAYAGFAVLVVLLGGVVPGLVIAAGKHHDSIPAAGVVKLTAQQEHGRQLFSQRCTYCHSLKAANAVAQVGPNLDQLRPPKSLVLDAIHHGRARGNGQMARDLVQGKDAEDVASFVAASVGQTGK